MRVVKSGIGSDLFRGTCLACNCEVESTRSELAAHLYNVYAGYGEKAPDRVGVVCPECGSATRMIMHLIPALDEK